MNIAFITRFQVVETQGGTERITKSVGDILSHKYGIKCFSLFFIGLSDDKTGIFEDEAIVNNFNREGSIIQFLQDWDIDIVISQNEFEIPINLRKIVDRRIKLVFVHHYQPGWEARTLGLSMPIRRLIYGNKENRKLAFKQILGAPYLFYKRKKLSTLYKRTYNCIDRLVLLSKGFVKPFSEYASIEMDDNKISVIPNMLSFDTFANEAQIKGKQKRVLVVSRMEETQKRISKILKIWELIKKDSRFSDWILDIVGNGPDIKYYRKRVKRNNIPDIIFHGTQDPRPFYLRSPIMLMTSASEGWGLTLTEAQQFGCIPIAFDTYESLHDIIDNGKNGFVIPRDDLEGYINKLKDLMFNYSNLSPIMTNAVESSKRFIPEKVGKLWFDMLSSL